VEGHQEDPACGAAVGEGDVRARNLEDNRLGQEAAWTRELVLVQVQILLEVGSLVAGDHRARVPALLEYWEGVDRVVEAAVMDQDVVGPGEARKLYRGLGAQVAAVVHLG
jgi:hypothetical protein